MDIIFSFFNFFVCTLMFRFDFGLYKKFLDKHIKRLVLVFLLAVDGFSSHLMLVFLSFNFILR